MNNDCGDVYTELANKVCPRLRDLATAPSGGITQPRANIFGHLCAVAIECPRLSGLVRTREWDIERVFLINRK